MSDIRKAVHTRLATAAMILTVAFGAEAQSGGGFEITEAVVAGSGTSSSNGSTSVDSTAGQPVAGGAVGAYPFTLTSGFWNFSPLAPTAAHVSISGRVVDPSGYGVANAVLYLQTQSGGFRISRSSAFGYYQFEGVEAGQTVLIGVTARQYEYRSRTVNVADDITDLDFFPEQAQPEDEKPQSEIDR